MPRSIKFRVIMGLIGTNTLENNIESDKMKENKIAPISI